METTTERYLTPKDVAQQIQIKEKTLANWRWAGCGPRFTKLGASVRYRQSDIDAWANLNVFGSTTAAQKAA